MATSNLAKETSDTSHTALHYATIAEVATLIRNGKITSLQLTQLMLERIAALDNRYNSFITVMAEQSIASAIAMDNELASGRYRGPLHGIPVGLKDIVYTSNAPTTAGHLFKADFIPNYNAAVVDKLTAAGAVIIGKQNLTEGAMCGYNNTTKIARNPWGQDLWTGLSSSGSAIALAAGFCFGSVASDTGGSIRFPSLANGVTGLKPTFGLVSCYGVQPLSVSMDHIGTMGRSVMDAAILLDAIADLHEMEYTSLNGKPVSITASINERINGLKIGIDRGYNSRGVDVSLTAAINNAVEQLEAMGALIVPFTMPGNNEERLNAWFTICAKEALASNKGTWPSMKNEYGKNYASLLEMGESFSEEQYKKAKLFQQQFTEDFRALLQNFDAVVMPAGGMAAGVTDALWRGRDSVLAELGDKLYMHFALVANLAGIPALTLPCGKAENGFPPPALQLMGGPLCEPVICRIAHAYEQAAGWNKQHPDV
jgi:amidase